MILMSNLTLVTCYFGGNAFNSVPSHKSKQQLVLSDETISACLHILCAVAFLDKLWIL